MPSHILKKLLKLKIITLLFSSFEEQAYYEREEAEFAKRLLKDNSGNEIDGVGRRDVEKLVYLKRIGCVQRYMQFSNKNDNTKVLVEMLYKFYLIDKEHRD